MRITMIGHCTLLIETADGARLLTDPFFGAWRNPLYGRLAPPSSRRQELLDVDLVLISHNHFDHADAKFLRLLAGDVPVVAPRREQSITRLLGAQHPVGLKTWESCTFGAVKVTAVPAIHAASANGYVIETGDLSVYFAGDTRYGAFLAEIGRRFHPQIALLPLSTYRIPLTMGVKDAARAARDLQAEWVIPIHQGMGPLWRFLLTRNSFSDLQQLLQAAGGLARLVSLREGETWDAASSRVSGRNGLRLAENEPESNGSG